VFQNDDNGLPISAGLRRRKFSVLINKVMRTWNLDSQF